MAWWLSIPILSHVVDFLPSCSSRAIQTFNFHRFFNCFTKRKGTQIVEVVIISPGSFLDFDLCSVTEPMHGSMMSLR